MIYKQVPQGSCTCGAHKVKSEGHYDWCDGLNAKIKGNPNKHLQAGNRAKIDNIIKGGGWKAHDDLDEFIMSQPKGSIDFDHVHKKLGPHVLDKTMERWFDHHTEGAKSLDDLYHDHGGIGAVEHALGRDLVNPTPWIYLDKHDNNVKNKQLHHNIMDALAPGKGKANWDTEAYEEFPDDEVKRKAREDEYQDDISQHIHPAKHDKVADIWDSAMNGNDPNGWSPGHQQAFDEAVRDRALDAFKRKHGLI